MTKKHKINRNKDKNHSEKQDSNQINHENKTQIQKSQKGLIKRIFNAQTISLFAAIISTIIAILQTYEGKKITKDSILERQREDSIIHHDKLVLRLGGFDLPNNCVSNIDVISGLNKFGKGVIPFQVEIYNGGNFNAKNIRGIVDGDLPHLIASYDLFEKFDTTKCDNKFFIKNITPKSQITATMLYLFINIKQGEKKHLNLFAPVMTKKIQL